MELKVHVGRGVQQGNEDVGNTGPRGQGEMEDVQKSSWVAQPGLIHASSAPFDLRTALGSLGSRPTAGQVCVMYSC